MALNKTILKASIKAAFWEAKANEDNSAQAIDTLCDKIATAVDTYIKTATVTVAFPIPVTVVPATGVGGTSATGIGTIS